MKSLQLIEAVLIVSVGTVVAQGAKKCDANEVFATCGTCEATCKQPHPICTDECRPAGCYCPVKGFVRDSSGKCVPASTCSHEPWSSESHEHKHHRCPPIKCPPGRKCVQPECPPPIKCPPNERYEECGTCEGTCKDRNPICALYCRPPGCYCPRDGYVRDAEGKCVPVCSCPSVSPSESTNPCAEVTCPPGETCEVHEVECVAAPCHPIAECVPTTSEPTPTCPTHERYEKCGTCENTCEDRHPICSLRCREPGCYCPRDGYARDAEGNCVPESQCNVSPSPRVP